MLIRKLVQVIPWGEPPEVLDRDVAHYNGWGYPCDGRLWSGEECVPCEDCPHPICRHHPKDATCLDCDREDGVCRS